MASINIVLSVAVTQCNRRGVATYTFDTDGHFSAIHGLRFAATQVKWTIECDGR